MIGKKCFANFKLNFIPLYQQIMRMWLTSDVNRPPLTGESGWDLDWYSVGVGIGPCRAVVSFLKSDNGLLCPPRSDPRLPSPTVSPSHYWWEEYPLDADVSEADLSQSGPRLGEDGYI
eukprot:GHVH01013399.1.p3 GENE.GHVH01013399.1~~GHVH01013399.1.p3  ORF type:complete len:118 (-),score=17.23 GHVH01013399.1:71-424(-)